MLMAPDHPRTRRVALGTIGLCLLVVAVLGTAVALTWTPLLRLDDVVSRALYVGDDRPDQLALLLQVLTGPGLSVFRAVVYLPVLIWLLVRRRWWTAGWVALATLGVGLVVLALKELEGRGRPDFLGGGAGYDSYSFPSGHSAGIACLVTAALVLGWPLLTGLARRWWAIAGVALVLLVGATRMWLGVHFLSDVVAGWSVGIAWTVLAAFLLGGLPGGPAALESRGAP